jgi:hypothetical protein
MPTECALNFIQCRLTWSHHVAGQVVGIQEGDARRAQVRGCRGFTHADATRQGYCFHLYKKTADAEAAAVCERNRDYG